MKCLKCGSENVKIMVDVTIGIPSSLAHKLTKKVFQSKDVTLWSANWDKADVVCADCNYVSKGC